MRDGYTAGTLSEADRVVVEQRRRIQLERKHAIKNEKEGGGSVAEWRGGVVVDLGFDDLMTDQVSILAKTGEEAEYSVSIGNCFYVFSTIVSILLQPYCR